jgi:hypothetical protein
MAGGSLAGGRLEDFIPSNYGLLLGPARLPKPQLGIEQRLETDRVVFSLRQTANVDAKLQSQMLKEVPGSIEADVSGYRDHRGY